MNHIDLISSQTDLFASASQQTENRTFTLKDADISLFPVFISEPKKHEIFQRLLVETDWQQQYMNFYGKRVPEPRLMALYGNSSRTYSYSGITMKELKITELLSDLKLLVEAISKCEFTSILLNQYRNENDSVSWHSDSEPELGRQPIIASLSFGAGRRFMLKHKTDGNQRLNIYLESGSLLIMKGDTQHYWLHQVPKEKTKTATRINLTFRRIY